MILLGLKGTLRRPLRDLVHEINCIDDNRDGKDNGTAALAVSRRRDDRGGGTAWGAGAAVDSTAAHPAASAALASVATVDRIN